jgi:hypothetical protein
LERVLWSLKCERARLCAFLCTRLRQSVGSEVNTFLKCTRFRSLSCNRPSDVSCRSIQAMDCSKQTADLFWCSVTCTQQFTSLVPSLADCHRHRHRPCRSNTSRATATRTRTRTRTAWVASGSEVRPPIFDIPCSSLSASSPTDVAP